MTEPPQLDRPRRVHLLGIGGAGMSGIAEVLVAMGHRVSGSDQVAGPVLRRLAEIGVVTHVGHDPANLGDADLVGVSSAVRPDNPELVAARRRGLDVRPRADLLAAISYRRPTLAVTGTHGKTTTSALTVAAARGAGFDPSFIIGGVVRPDGTGARWGAGPWFVLEADESDSSFLAPRRVGAVITNVEADHLDHHGTYEALVGAFERFAVGTDGPVVVCVDDPGAAALRVGPARVGYGTSPDADVRILGVEIDGLGSRWRIRSAAGWEVAASVPQPGLHLVRNATAAVALVAACGGDPDAAAAGLAAYGGVGRRFEPRGEAGGVTFVDDYAHLPTEVAATLDAARAAQGQRGWRRVVAVVQPHRYSRTEATADQYRDLFAPTDVVVVTDVYAAGEDPLPGVTGRLVADAVRSGSRPPAVHWFATRDELVAGLLGLLQPGDLCLTLGAGDLTTLPDVLVDRLS